MWPFGPLVLSSIRYYNISNRIYLSTFRKAIHVLGMLLEILPRDGHIQGVS